MMSVADAVVAAAELCIGTQFKHQGRLAGFGLDCAGLAIVCARSAGIEVADYKGYPRQPFDGMLKKLIDLQAFMHEVPREQLAAGDVLLMRISSAPQHIGIYCGNEFMVHAYQVVGRVVKQRLDDAWRKRIVAVYRFVK